MSDDIVERLLPFVVNEMRMPAGLTITVIDEIERLRKRLQACQSIDALPLTDDCITQNERMLFTENERLRAERDDLHVLLRGRTAELQAEIEGLRGNQRAVVALARSVLGESEHPVERSPWIDVIHMMDEEARRER